MMSFFASTSSYHRYLFEFENNEVIPSTLSANPRFKWFLYEWFLLEWFS